MRAASWVEGVSSRMWMRRMKRPGCSAIAAARGASVEAAGFIAEPVGGGGDVERESAVGEGADADAVYTGGGDGGESVEGDAAGGFELDAGLARSRSSAAACRSLGLMCPEDDVDETGRDCQDLLELGEGFDFDFDEGEVGARGAGGAGGGGDGGGEVAGGMAARWLSLMRTAS